MERRISVEAEETGTPVRRRARVVAPVAVAGLVVLFATRAPAPDPPAGDQIAAPLLATTTVAELRPRVFPGTGGFTAAVPAGGTLYAWAGIGHAELWSSQEGLRWRHRGTVFPQGQVTGATSVGDALVAVGAALDRRRPRPGIWWSPDGRRWAQVARLTDTGAVAAVTGGEWGVVAVGWDGRTVAGEDGALVPEEGAHPAIWVSPDGLSWDQLDFPDVAGHLLAVTRRGQTLYAGGETGGIPTVWTADLADVTTWTAIPGFTTQTGVVSALAAAEDTVLAVVTGRTDPNRRAEAAPRVWSLLPDVRLVDAPELDTLVETADAILGLGDGAAWRWDEPGWAEVVSSPGRMATALATTGGLILLGDRDSLPAVWARDPVDVEMAGPRADAWEPVVELAPDWRPVGVDAGTVIAETPDGLRVVTGGEVVTPAFEDSTPRIVEDLLRVSGVWYLSGPMTGGRSGVWASIDGRALRLLASAGAAGERRTPPTELAGRPTAVGPFASQGIVRPGIELEVVNDYGHDFVEVVGVGDLVAGWTDDPRRVLVSRGGEPFRTLVEGPVEGIAAAGGRLLVQMGGTGVLVLFDGGPSPVLTRTSPLPEGTRIGADGWAVGLGSLWWTEDGTSWRRLPLDLDRGFTGRFLGFVPAAPPLALSDDGSVTTIWQWSGP